MFVLTGEKKKKILVSLLTKQTDKSKQKTPQTLHMALYVCMKKH